MSLSVATPAAPEGDYGNTQGHCSRCGKVWTLKERQVHEMTDERDFVSSRRSCYYLV